MRLLLLHPGVAARSCDECQRWIYNDRPGQFAAEPLYRGGKRVERPARTIPCCTFCPKQPDDVPEDKRRPWTAVELSDKNWQAYQHYKECRAVGAFPDDPIIRQNAALIREIEDAAAAVRQARLPLMLMQGR